MRDSNAVSGGIVESDDATYTLLLSYFVGVQMRFAHLANYIKSRRDLLGVSGHCCRLRLVSLLV